MSTVTDSSSGSLLPGFVRRRYAVKFAVSILVVLLLIAAVGAYGYDQADDAVTQSTESQLVETSELQADSLAQWVESMRVQTATVSAGTPLTEGGAATAYLREEQARMSADILSIHLANGQRGEVVASTVGPLAGRNFGELPGNPAWTTADVETGNSEAEDQVWVSAQSYQSPVHDEAPVIAFASAVPGQDGQYVVVVSRIQSFLGTVKGTDTASETVILNGADQPVLDPDTEFDVGVHTENVRAARSSGGADFRLGETDVSAYAPVNGTDWNDDDANDWVAVTTVSKRQAFAVRDTVAQNDRR
jgi:methyl-accepting chemotaxis protein